LHILDVNQQTRLGLGQSGKKIIKETRNFINSISEPTASYSDREYKREKKKTLKDFQIPQHCTQLTNILLCDAVHR